MPLTTTDFTVTKIQGNNSTLRFADTSVGSDSGIASRRILILTPYGTYLKSGSTDYNVWLLSETTKDLSVLNQDYGLKITVQWVNGSGTILYSKDKIVSISTLAKLGFYGMTQTQTTSKPATKTFYNDKLNLKLEIDNATNAVLYGSDIMAAQSALNRAALITRKYVKS